MLKNFRCQLDRHDQGQSWRPGKIQAAHMTGRYSIHTHIGEADKETESMGGRQSGREGDKKRDQQIGERREMKREEEEQPRGGRERREGVEQICSLWETCSGYRNVYSLFVDFSSAGQTWTISGEVGRSFGS